MNVTRCYQKPMPGVRYEIESKPETSRFPPLRYSLPVSLVKSQPRLTPIRHLAATPAAAGNSAPFYGGDSVGRRHGFNATVPDSKFALNIGVDFHT